MSKNEEGKMQKAIFIAYEKEKIRKILIKISSKE